MLAIIAALFFTSAQAQDSEAFALAHQSAIECLEKSQNLDDRRKCYAICSSVNENPDQALECSRLKMKTEKEILSERYSEEGRDRELKSLYGMTHAGCKLLTIRSRSELALNECLAEQYMEKETALIAQDN